MDISLEPKNVVRYLLYIIIGLTVFHIIGQIYYLYLKGPDVFQLVQLFDLGREKNIPTLFSTITLLFCAQLLMVIAFAKRRENDKFYFHWIGLSLIFVFLSIDEFAGIHERLIKPLKNSFELTGPLYFAWIIPYLLFVGVIFIVYLKFLFSLSNRTRVLFIISGALYVFGAIGFEMLEGIEYEGGRNYGFLYTAFVTMEELFEMLGILIFIYALLSFIVSGLKGVRFCIKADSSINSGCN